MTNFTKRYFLIFFCLLNLVKQYWAQKENCMKIQKMTTDGSNLRGGSEVRNRERGDPLYIDRIQSIGNYIKVIQCYGHDVLRKDASKFALYLCLCTYLNFSNANLI